LLGRFTQFRWTVNCADAGPMKAPA
jgi:hypothetical protein